MWFSSLAICICIWCKQNHVLSWIGIWLHRTISFPSREQLKMSLTQNLVPNYFLLKFVWVRGRLSFSSFRLIHSHDGFMHGPSSSKSFASTVIFLIFFAQRLYLHVSENFASVWESIFRFRPDCCCGQLVWPNRFCSQRIPLQVETDSGS